MQRFLTFVVLVLLTVPVGLSIQGCANKNSEYCNGAGYGYLKSQPISISLQPQTTGLSVAFSQTSQLQAPSALNCTGGTASISTYTYGTTDRTIADVSPTGAVCGGTWNLQTPAVAAYTTCLPTNKTGVAYMTASADGFTSNQVAVYSHPNITTLAVQGPTSGGQPQCLSQGQTSQLDATAYCTSTGKTGACPSSTIATGQPVLICSPDILPNNAGYGPTDCNNVIGHLTYSPTNSGIVTIDQNGVATAQAPGSTLITGTIAQTSSNAGYFYTCPAAKISLTVASQTSSTSASVDLNTPLSLTATVTDTNNNVINGLPLTYVSTNPGSIAVSSTGSVTASYPSNSAITAICQPTTCNPAPINKMGTLGTGVPALSNRVEITSPGRNSTYIWMTSPGSPYFVPIDLSQGTIGNQIKLPYSPNSMVLDPTGTTLYFGSYKELMSYTALSNTLASEAPTVPGVVLAVSPTNTTVVINDQLRGVLYLYTPSNGSYTSFAGIAQKAAFSPDGNTVYMLGNGTLYIHNVFTGWSVDTLPSGQGTTGSGVCPATNTTSPIPTDPTSYPPNTTANPNNTFNKFCSPDLAITVPDAAAFLSGTTTSAYGHCPDTTVSPVVNYPEATTVAALSDHVAATTDGNHIIGASANPAVLTDLSITVPGISTTEGLACPSDADGQTTGFVFNPPPQINQTSLAAYGITNVNQVVASTNSTEAFVTYNSAATTPPAGGTLLPVYKPSSTAGTLGTLTGVALTGNALAPAGGIFSPDNTQIFVGTTGDNLLHIIDTSTLKDTQQINPKLTDINGNPLPPVLLAVKPRPTT